MQRAEKNVEFLYAAAIISLKKMYYRMFCVSLMVTTNLQQIDKGLKKKGIQHTENHKPQVETQREKKKRNPTYCYKLLTNQKKRARQQERNYKIVCTIQQHDNGNY